MNTSKKYDELLVALESLARSLRRRRRFMPHDWLFRLEDVRNELICLVVRERRAECADLSWPSPHAREAVVRLSTLVAFGGFGLTGHALCCAIESVAENLRRHLASCSAAEAPTRSY